MPEILVLIEVISGYYPPLYYISRELYKTQNVHSEP